MEELVRLLLKEVAPTAALEVGIDFPANNQWLLRSIRLLVRSQQIIFDFPYGSFEFSKCRAALEGLTLMHLEGLEVYSI